MERVLSGVSLMSKLLSTGQCRIALQFCAAGAVAALMSGCSSDATRLGDPLGNPFSMSSSEQAAPRRHVASASDVIPAGRTPPVTSQALAPRSVSVASLAPPRPAPTAAFREPVSAETTGSIETGPVRTAANSSFGGWSSAGGTPIQVADGENAEILAKRYGVPTNALLQVNGLKSAAEVRPGSRITIPIYGAVAQNSAPARVAEVAPKAESAAPKSARATREHNLAAHPLPTQTVAAATPATHMAPKQRVADKKGLAPAKETHMTAIVQAPVTGAKAKIAPASLAVAPASKLAATKAASVPQVAAKAVPVQTATVASAKAEKLAAAQPLKTAGPQPASASPAPAVVAAAPAATATAENNPEFRWPARGRIIQSFKGGSGGNDGINIAVPEGTSVKAAEGGVVAYAGSELKGYGNLVLIRHPNGFVSAYANNGEIDVKRGETVKRGQQIAKSGQSGNVSSPQLHFELRKGSTPVDPTQYLAGL
jgi:murein DD-endopeptidase MepM/ murein hydrolase activator NlpD